MKPQGKDGLIFIAALIEIKANCIPGKVQVLGINKAQYWSWFRPV